MGLNSHFRKSTNPTRRPSQLRPNEDEKLLPPASVSNSAARSSEDFAMPPILSVSGDHGLVPSVDRSPAVALRPYSAALFAGCTIEPSVSVARESGAKPAAIPTALPEDDPPGVCLIH